MKPLKGQRVIDLTQNVAGPYCTQILTDLGADVIKIERPVTGDDTRQWAPAISKGMTATFFSLNRGKRSLALNFDHPSGSEVLKKLLKPNDIFIHALKPGSAEQRGFGYDDLQAHVPGLIYCAISAFGNVGPFSGLPGYDPLIQAYSGIMSVNGHENTAPARVGVSLVDMGTGLWSALGITLAILTRQSTGKGSRVDTSLLETGLAWMTIPLANYSTTGKLPKRMGSATSLLTPYEVFESSNGHVFIGCGNDRQFSRLLVALDLHHLQGDPRFLQNQSRVDNRQILYILINEVTRRLSSQQIVDTLREHDIPVSEVKNTSHIISDPQIDALDIRRSMNINDNDGVAVPIQGVAIPIRLNQHRAYSFSAPVSLGSQGEEILQEAGFTHAMISKLVNDGTIAI